MMTMLGGRWGSADGAGFAKARKKAAARMGARPDNRGNTFRRDKVMVPLSRLICWQAENADDACVERDGKMPPVTGDGQVGNAAAPRKSPLLLHLAGAGAA